MTANNISPLEIVNQRMARYNEHDLEAFLSLYSPNVEIYTYPNELLGKGLDHMRRIFTPLFAEKFVQVEIKHQMVSGNFVVNEELVTYPDRLQRYISIYEIQDGLIQNIRFMRD